uniref:CASP-like protein Ni6 n=1 Tax=Beta vulgaris subsp. maritima TaxID=350892 RepID=CSPL1_BETVM|nr:RecName: Full=CASP-like protein Ni6; AltName: Full=CASP-like protein 1D1; Short=BvCASPL1D1 [Beta vulgaris subsp. maritima]ADA71986.1 Ni6 protein [Beta vulgaris subsp. maritima]
MSSMETEKGAVPTPQAPPVAPTDNKYRVVDVILRVLLLAASIASVVLMVTSKQTEIIVSPFGSRPNAAKFQNSPAFIYLVAALSVAGLYSIITALVSLSYMRKPIVPPKLFWILLIHDVLLLGIVAAATGTAGGVGYIGLKGNTHVRWGKIRNVYDKFCRHVGASIIVSLFAAAVLVLLVFVNANSLYRRIPKY